MKLYSTVTQQAPSALLFWKIILAFVANNSATSQNVALFLGFIALCTSKCLWLITLYENTSEEKQGRATVGIFFCKYTQYVLCSKYVSNPFFSRANVFTILFYMNEKQTCDNMDGCRIWISRVWGTRVFSSIFLIGFLNYQSGSG